ncbi:hypothetical protein PWT90_03831 [Aphanocladium album]|nr:hypothetical protein PWT90_03831 [Aphanocladium album]
MSSAAADDEVYPTGRIDNALSVKPMVLSLTLRFDDVLDADRLHAALATLLDTGDWRRLGGRLRRPAKDAPRQTLEIHAPRAFSEDRPPLTYSHEDLSDVSIAEHPLGKDLPEVNGADARLCPSGGHFRAFAAAKEFPNNIDGFTAPGAEDMPAMSLRVTSFKDATLVAVGVPHLLVDAMALGELLHAWSLVLAGRGDEVPPVLGAHDDALYDAADPAKTKDDEEPWVLQSVYLAGFAFVLFLLRFLWSIVTELTIEAHGVYVPRRVVEKLRADAMADVAAQAKKNGADPTKAWVSEGDVLFAWLCRIVSLGQGGSPRPLNAHNALNLRNRLPETTPSQGAGGGGVYAKNLITLSYLPVSAAEARGSVGLLAAKYRAALKKQATTVQALWTLRAARASVDAGKDGNVICGAPPTGELLSMTNWLKGDVAGVTDFSPAVVRAGTERKHVPGKIVYVHSQLHEQSTLIRNTLGVVGKDQDGNLWMQGFFPPRTWAALQKELDELNKE